MRGIRGKERTVAMCHTDLPGIVESPVEGCCTQEIVRESGLG